MYLVYLYVFLLFFVDVGMSLWCKPMSFALGRCFFRIGLDVYVYVYNVVDTRFVCPLAKPIVVLNSFFYASVVCREYFFCLFTPPWGSEENSFGLCRIYGVVTLIWECAYAVLLTDFCGSFCG